MSLNKLFVNFKGTKAQFENVKAQYANQIVFINEGKSIYARGAYYGSIDEAIAGLKYFTSIKVGEKVASAPDNKGTITFAADSEASIALDVDKRGITIGLSQATKDAIAAAAVKADVDAEFESVKAQIKALEDLQIASRLEVLEEAIGLGVEGEEPDGTVTAQLASLATKIADEEARAKKAEGDLDAAYKAADAQVLADAKAHAEGLASNYDAAGSAAQALVDAKAYADGLVYDDTALADRVEAAEGAIDVLKGEGEGSVKKSVADAIAGVVASAPEDFDTLKEIADYIASDKTGAADLNNAISANATAIANEKSRAELAESGLDTRVKAIEEAGFEGRVAAIEADYLKAADKTELQGKIDAKVAQADYDAKVAELAQAAIDAEANAKSYADGKFQVAGNYEAAGEAAKAQAAAQAYADGLAANYEVAGAAAKAQSAAEATAKAYTDKLGETVTANGDAIDALEAFLNDPWEDVNA